MAGEAVLIAGNAAIVQSLESSELDSTRMSLKVILQYFNDINETVSLAIAPSKSISEDQYEDKYADIKILFGSWIECGEEDVQIEELYRSRLYPSHFPEE